MKKIPVCSILLIGLSAILYSTSLQAQLLKRILDRAQQTTQNKATNKVADTNNRDTGNNSSVYIDTAATYKVLGAFAKAAEQNPNDTSAADVTMKALGLLVGGGGVSTADSVAAIKSFMTGSGGSGMFYQYLTVLTSKQNGTTRDTTSQYMAGSGYGRSEMRINIPGAVTNKMITISHAAQPKYGIMLYPDSKTYSLNIIDTSLINSGRETYKVTKVGNENVQGYNCVHSKLTSSMNSAFLKSSTTFDIWTSAEVPGYSMFEKLIALQNIQPKMMQALTQAGCNGFFVKMTSSDKDYSMEMLLVKADKKTFPGSLFEIPAGYTESKQNMMYHMAPAPKK